MLSKTRTTLIAVVAAFSFAGASMAPAVSEAMTKQEFVSEVAKKPNLTNRDPAPPPWASQPPTRK
jgi:hypothetical protein